jgi:hypothetical protein
MRDFDLSPEEEKIIDHCILEIDKIECIGKVHQNPVTREMEELPCENEPTAIIYNEIDGIFYLCCKECQIFWTKLTTISAQSRRWKSLNIRKADLETLFKRIKF